MAEQFKYLFKPIRIGSITVRNRIVNTAHQTLFAENNLPNERYVYYYAEKAKGGVGLIIVEGVSVHPTSQHFRNEVFGFDERAIPGFKGITKGVHRHGAKIFLQLWHCGRQITSFFSRSPVWAPSAIPCRVVNETPHEMEIEEIKEVISGFAEAAANAQAGGFDGVEVHGAHGYLIHQFLSPLSNRRTDEYGGSLENRMRFANEVIDAVRKECGREFVVGMRISGDELQDGGLTLDDMRVIAPKLEATGKIDYISVSAGNYTTETIMLGDMNVPLGAIVYLAAGIKEVINLPVFTVLRINDPIQAEKILAEGSADMIGMCRALICDPELPNKARDGRLDDIRKCVACNQGCAGSLIKGEALRCIQNPAVGKEKELGIGTIKPAGTKKKVLVVGGGPAGMEAARVARERGHEVVLYERNTELGGQVNIAAIVPNRQEFGDVVRYLRKQVEKLGVRINLGEEVTMETVETEDPDVVIVATGSRPVEPAIKGMENSDINVVNVRDVLQDKVKVGERVIVVDGGEAYWQSCSVVELLVGQGKKVDVVTKLFFVGMEIPLGSVATFYQRILRRGATLKPLTVVKEIVGGTVVLLNIYSKEENRIEGVDTLVVEMGSIANNELYHLLKGQVKEIYGIGDCLAPRKEVAHAIREGNRIGRII